MMVFGVVELIFLVIIFMVVMALATMKTRSINAKKQRAAEAAFPEGKPDFDSIRQRVERRFHRRYELAAHIVMYLVIVGGLWALRLPGMALALIAGAWGLVVLIHGLQILFAEMSDSAIEREIERERSRFYEADKPKRSQHLRLSDEGELLDVIEEEWEAEEKYKRG
ncbi:MAG: 2TM domain-containing protein [Chloroflexi bacterium]|nr:2TM domain-containing protein [Chloroflexota bacterium]